MIYCPHCNKNLILIHDGKDFKCKDCGEYIKVRYDFYIHLNEYPTSEYNNHYFITNIYQYLHHDGSVHRQCGPQCFFDSYDKALKVLEVYLLKYGEGDFLEKAEFSA